MNAFRLSVLGLLIAAHTIVSAYAASGNLSEEGLKPVPNPPPVGDWWLASWQPGWNYRHESGFEFKMKVKLDVDQQGNLPEGLTLWNKVKAGWASWDKKQRSKYSGNFYCEASGDSQIITTVPVKDDNGVVLLRYFPEVQVARSIHQEPINDPTFTDRMMKAVLSGEISEEVQKPVKVFRVIALLVCKTAVSVAGTSAAATAAAPNPATPVAALSAGGIAATAGTAAGVALAIDKLLENYGDDMDDFLREATEKRGLKLAEGGGIEIEPEGSFFKKHAPATMSSIDNLAMTLSMAFKGKGFALASETEDASSIVLKSLNDKIGKDFLKRLDAPTEINNLPLWIRSELPSLSNPKPEQSGVLQRESFGGTSELFDRKERKPGDVWIIQARYFNQFLHADLRGKFGGKAILRYARDLQMSDGKEQYEARKIDVVFSPQDVDGTTERTSLAYSEPTQQDSGQQFSAKPNERSQISVIVDKNGDYVRKAYGTFHAEASEATPDLALTRGLVAVGAVEMHLKYACYATGRTAEPTGD